MSETKTGGKAVGDILAAATSKKTALIDMKEAVQRAFTFGKDFYPQGKDFRLEEVEPVSGGWSVVLSFVTGEPGTLALALGQGSPRIYKTITIDSNNGRAQSLKVWKQ
jgi:hypothetical protein